MHTNLQITEQQSQFVDSDKFVVSNRSRGFTLAEIITVLGVMVILLSITVGYGAGSRRTINLINEQAKLVNALLRAKAFALQTFAKPGATERVCGYGIHFTSTGYILFKDIAPSLQSDCVMTADRSRANNGSEDIEAITLSAGFVFDSTPPDVLFIPPEPRVIITGNLNEAVVTISTDDKTLSKKVRFNSVGQVSGL